MEVNLIIALVVGFVLLVGSILLWVFADPFKIAEKQEKKKKDKDLK